MTHKDCNATPVTLEGTFPPKLLFLTSVSDFNFDNEEKRLSGNALIPVWSS